MPGPDAAFWQQRFESGDTPWDRGAPSPQLLRWIQQATLAPCRIAVPGCGTGWEAVELARCGFEVVAVDYSAAACERTTARAREAGVRLTVERADVTLWRPERPFDAVYEQTCLCALHPSRWRAYADSIESWIRPGGRLLALFMQRPREAAVAQGIVEGPPYHCDLTAMHALLPDQAWAWPRGALVKVPHPAGWHELAAVIERRGAASPGSAGAHTFPVSG